MINTALLSACCEQTNPNEQNQLMRCVSDKEHNRSAAPETRIDIAQVRTEQEMKISYPSNNSQTIIGNPTCVGFY